MSVTMQKRASKRRPWTLANVLSCIGGRQRRYLCLLLVIGVSFLTFSLLTRAWCDDSYYWRAIGDHGDLQSEPTDRSQRQSITDSGDAALRNELVCESLYPKVGDGNPLNVDRKTRSSDVDRVTVVTGYFHMPPFCKTRFDVFDTDLYLQWMAAYALVLNPVIFYTDHVESARYFMDLRSSSALLRNRTQICVLRRSSLWSFQLLPEIERVLARDGYPKHIPNTVLPEYGAVQHAKYALMRLAINSNPYKTGYFAWFDVGLFRLIVENDPSKFRFDDQDFRVSLAEKSEQELVRLGFFEAVLPPGFDRKRVAYNKALRGRARLNLPVGEYFERNLVLVGGGAFVGERGVLGDWLSEYEKFVRLLLTLGWSSTDQQVLYAMHSDKLRPMRNGSLQVQLYAPRQYLDPLCWFYLPMLMRQTYIERVLHNRTLVHIDREHTFESSSAVSSVSTRSGAEAGLDQLEFDPRSFPLPIKYWLRYYESLLLELFTSD